MTTTSFDLSLIRDPLTGQSLRTATSAELKAVAEALGSERLDALLISEDGKRGYPVEGGLALLLGENCLQLESLLSKENQL